MEYYSEICFSRQRVFLRIGYKNQPVLLQFCLVLVLITLVHCCIYLKISDFLCHCVIFDTILFDKCFCGRPMSAWLVVVWSLVVLVFFTDELCTLVEHCMLTAAAAVHKISGSLHFQMVPNGCVIASAWYCFAVPLTCIWFARYHEKSCLSKWSSLDAFQHDCQWRHCQLCQIFFSFTFWRHRIVYSANKMNFVRLGKQNEDRRLVVLLLLWMLCWW